MLKYNQDTINKHYLYVLIGESNMPNHCYNRVTIYGSGNDTDETRAQIAKLKAIFEDENVFGQIIPEPDWANTPLLTSDNRFGTKYGNDGELPQYVDCLLYTSPSPRDLSTSRMPSSA